MEVTESGISTEVKAEQSENILSLMLVKPLGKVTCFSLLQDANIPFPTVATESGSASSVKALHWLNADSPISVRFSERVMLVNSLQPEKANVPIVFTPFPMSTLLK